MYGCFLKSKVSKTFGHAANAGPTKRALKEGLEDPSETFSEVSSTVPHDAAAHEALCLTPSSTVSGDARLATRAGPSPL